MERQSDRIPDGDSAEQDTDFLRAAIDEILIVAVTDVNGIITHVNERFCHISGYSPHELIGRTHRVVNSGFHSKAFFKRLHDTISAGKIWRGKICNRAKNGLFYWVATTIIPYRDRSGKITAYLAYRFDVTPLVEARNKMKQMARQDPLVDGLNRIGFAEELAQVVSASIFSSEAWILIKIDLNGFKEVNDIYGHDIGDLVLIEIARRLRRFGGKDSVVGRLGGDEFALLLRYPASCISVESYLQRLLDLIEQPIHTGPTNVSVSAGIGYTKISPNVCSGQQFLKEVDIALLETRHNRGKGVVGFSPSLRTKALRRQQTMSEARLGIERGEFELYYQPIINLAQRKVVSCEALLRWHHPRKGLITPEVFSEVFEDFRLGLSIGRFVRETAIREAALWLRNGVYQGSIAINLSVSDFGVDSLTAELGELMEREKVSRKHIEIEITENIFLGASRSDRVRREICNLAQAGFAISFDDFGTGYAAISHLRELPLTHIKIDRSFVTNIAQNDRDEKITSGLIALARSIGLSTVAEGVETVEQLRLLRGLGCTNCQGYLFSRPLPAADMPAAIQHAHLVLEQIHNDDERQALAG
ncbi:putative bifunctional diguanylate cyclase/phosphodiesterase [Acetobacter sp.]|uniref:putative bifunctional diguanylate cyclase/phosphodiesterase n=1 Tax=Acetobacter sp. TaxID=440 RepID=UPI0039EB590F